MSVLIFLVAALGVWKTAQYISGFLEDQWLLDPQKRALQKKFESWWFTVAESKPRYFAVALARSISDLLTDFFGKRLFSKKAFVRSTTIATGLLMASLAFSTLLGTGVNPWKQFQSTVDAMTESTERIEAKRTATEQETKEEAEAARWLQSLAERYGGAHWKAIYCAVFIAALLASNAMAFSLSVAFSRLVLHEIVASGRVFAACSLLALNLFIVTSIATLFLLFLTLIAYPVFWVLLPLAYILSKTSIYWLLAMLFGSGIAVWAFGNPFLQMVSLIAFLPCITAVAVCAFSVIAQTNRKRFHAICCALLLRCTGKKPLSFIIGFLGGIGVAIALVCKSMF
jgi:hypothetical protein